MNYQLFSQFVMWSTFK